MTIRIASTLTIATLVQTLPRVVRLLTAMGMSGLVVACNQSFPATPGSTVAYPGEIAGVWCETDQQGAPTGPESPISGGRRPESLPTVAGTPQRPESLAAPTADSECLAVWSTPSGYEYAWSTGLKDETEHGTIASGRGLHFIPSYETFCYFGPNAGQSGHFVAPSDCFKDYSAVGTFGDGTLTLRFATDSVVLTQFE